MQYAFFLLASFVTLTVAESEYVKGPPERNAGTLTKGEADDTMKDMADFHNKRECLRGKGYVEIPRARASVRFSRVKDVESIMKKLILEYCGLAAVMKEHNMLPPLYVEVGMSNENLLVEAVKAGCRVKSYRPTEKFFENARAAVSGNMLPDDIVALYKTALSNVTGIAKYREAGKDDDGLIGSRMKRYLAGDWHNSKRKFKTTEVEVSSLEKELQGEDVIPLVMIDGKGWDVNIVRGAMSLIDTHKVQSMAFRLWPAGIRDTTTTLPKEEIVALLRHLHRRGYYLYQTKPTSMNINDVPHGPTCVDNLVDYLDHTDTLDAYGASTFIIAAK